MEGLELNVTTNKDGVVTILQGAAPKPIEAKSTIIEGNIYAVCDYIKKRADCINANVNHCHVEIDPVKGKMSLFEGEDTTLCNIVTGWLLFHPDFTKWGINTDKRYSSHDLAMMIRMNRFMFESAEAAMTLVTIFQTLKVKVNKAVELSDDKRGNRTDMRSQIVESMSIPETFKINVPIYRGFSPVAISIEILIDADTLEISLISPQVNDIINDTTGSIMLELEGLILKETPGIAIVHS